MVNSQNSKRPKMKREDRAKQFMPFDALKGFREALAEKERMTGANPSYNEISKNIIRNKND